MRFGADAETGPGCAEAAAQGETQTAQINVGMAGDCSRDNRRSLPCGLCVFGPLKQRLRHWPQLGLNLCPRARDCTKGTRRRAFIRPFVAILTERGYESMNIHAVLQ